MESSDEELPESILKAAEIANLDLLPSKSRHRYEKEYTAFTSWCGEKKIKSMKEEVFMAYFAELAKTCKPNTLWSRYSMLKSVIKIEKNLDLSKYFKVTSFLKKQNVGFRPKKAKIFSKDEIAKFINDAPNDVYLAMKVATIFGLAGACRREELMKISIDDIDDKGNLLIVNIPDSKNHSSRSFVISEEIENGKYLALYRKYSSLRKPETPHRRFFVNYKKLACTVQCIGINTFGKMPSEIAAYLRLPNPELYTGHSFRRSSATMLANSGEGITNIKRLGGWKSSSVAEGYLESSTSFKKDLSNKILSQNSSTFEHSKTHSRPIVPSSSKQQCVSVTCNDDRFNCTSTAISNSATYPQQLASAIHLQNATNCSFTINVVNNNK